MLLSMDILAHELRDYVAYLHQQKNTDLDIEFCQLLDSSELNCSKEFIYLLQPDNYSSLPLLPDSTNVMCIGPIPEQVERYQKLNLIVISGISFTKVLNMAINVFRKYNELSLNLDRAIHSSKLSAILNTSAELLETPLCMMDMNHSILSMSTNLEPVGDSLWDAMKEGYGYQHYSIVATSVPNVLQMDEEGINVYDGISNISNRYIRVYLLRRGTKGIATLGLHRHTDCSKPFHRHTIQLADYVVARINPQLHLLSEFSMGRGKMCEQFIIDLLDGKLRSTEKIEDTMKNLKIQITPYYMLGMVLFKNPTLQNDIYYFLMDHIESCLPHCKCAMRKQRIVILYPSFNKEHPSEHLSTGLPELLHEYDCVLLLSNPFLSLLDLSSVERALEAISSYVLDSRDSGVYYYYQFSELHALHRLSQVIQLDAACHLSLLQLIEYDQAHNSDYYKTLVVYLRNNCNITLTSQELQVHRNSLRYRINKLEDVFGEQLTDRSLQEMLLFSIRCLEFQEAYGSSAATTAKPAVPLE